MSTRYVEKLLADRDAIAAKIVSIGDTAADEERELSADEKTAVTNMTAQVTSLDSEIRVWDSTNTSFRNFANITDKGSAKRKANENTALSLGEAFIRSAEYSNYRFSGSSGRFTVNETRAAITTGAAPGNAFITPDTGFSLPIPAYQTPILSLVNEVSVSSNSVEYVSYPAAAPLAGVVPEGTAKPEAVLTASVVSRSLSTIAHWVDVTRQALEDSAQLRSWIDGNLMRGVGDKLEALTAAEITGATLPTATGVDLLSGIRVGVATVQDAGYQPTAVLINPADAADIDIQIMNTAGTAPIGVNTLWGLRVVPAGAVPAGTAYVGSFTDGVTLFSRNQTQVYVTDSDGAKFVSNIFTVLAERRALPVVTRPEALAEVTVTP